MKRAMGNLVDVLDFRRAAVLLALATLLLVAGAVQAQTGDGPERLVSGVATGYDLSWWTVDSGGATVNTGGGYTLGGAAGQPDAIVWSGGGYVLAGGFWGGGAVEYHVYLPLVLRNYR